MVYDHLDGQGIVHVYKERIRLIAAESGNVCLGNCINVGSKVAILAAKGEKNEQ